MTAAPRRITITKRISLAEFADDWDDCYVIVTPADRATYEALVSSDIEKMTNNQAATFTMDTVKQHFVSGKIKVWNSDTQSFDLADMVPEDIDASLPLANKLYLEIMGVKLDPKGSSEEVPSDKQPVNSESTTATTSSTDSPRKSRLTSSETSTSSDTSSVEESPTTTP